MMEHSVEFVHHPRQLMCSERFFFLFICFYILNFICASVFSFASTYDCHEYGLQTYDKMEAIQRYTYKRKLLAECEIKMERKKLEPLCAYIGTHRHIQ